MVMKTTTPKIIRTSSILMHKIDKRLVEVINSFFYPNSSPIRQIQTRIQTSTRKITQMRWGQSAQITTLIIAIISMALFPPRKAWLLANNHKSSLRHCSSFNSSDGHTFSRRRFCRNRCRNNSLHWIMRRINQEMAVTTITIITISI